MAVDPTSRNPGRILIGTPAFGGSVCTEYVVSLLGTQAMLATYNLVADVALIKNDHFIDKARNSVLKKAIDGNYGTIFFIDADQGWDVNGFMRVLLRPQDIIVGIPPKKTDRLGDMFLHLVLETDENNDCIVRDGLLLAKRAGTGFMRISRDALARLLEAYPDRVSPGDGGEHDWIPWIFESGNVNGQFLGEDFGFCSKWTAIGGKIWIDPDIEFSHVGNKKWTGNYLEFLKQNAIVVTSNEQIS